MANKRLENLYNGVFRELYPQIKNQKRGVLYYLIYKLLEADQSQADIICHQIDIKENARREDDKKVVDDLMNNPEETLFNQFNVLNDKNEMELFWIVVIACALVGTYGCIRYLKSVRERKIKQQQVLEAASKTQPTSLPPKSITAALCLIVPALAISSLKDYLDPYDLEQLLDNASYFLCTTVDDANLKEQRLEMTNEDIPLDSNRDVYIRIHIADGQEMIDKKVPYILKRNLPSHGQGIVKLLTCLKNLSGLEVFNRI